MQIIVLANEEAEKELKDKNISEYTDFIFIKNVSEITAHKAADVFFILSDITNKDYKLFEGKPVLIHSLTHTLNEMRLPENFSRINGWITFLNRQIWEIATPKEDVIKEIFNKLNWKYILVPDEPGLISARVIAMIINEAYFALGEGVSTKDEIDLAMKLGTNYPRGPFEWSRSIGLKNVYQLLEKLSITDKRYTAAPALKDEILNR